MEGNRKNNVNNCVKYSKPCAQEDRCPYCIEKKSPELITARRGFLNHLSYNRAVYYIILVFFSLFSYLCTGNIVWHNLMFYSLMLLPILFGNMRRIIRVVGVIGMFVLVSLFTSPYTSPLDSSYEYSDGYITSGGTKENPYKLGEVGFFGDYTEYGEEVGKLSLVVNSVTALEDLIIEEVYADNQFNEEIKDLFVNNIHKTTSEAKYKFLLVNVTYANLTCEVSRLDYTQIKAVASGSYIVSQGDWSRFVDWEDMYGSYYNRLELKSIDGAYVYKGNTVTGDIVLAIDHMDLKPMLVYGNNWGWYSLTE